MRVLQGPVGGAGGRGAVGNVGPRQTGAYCPISVAHPLRGSHRPGRTLGFATPGGKAEIFHRGTEAQMKSSLKMILAAGVATLALAACKKPEQPAPTAPAEPQAQTSVSESASDWFGL